MTVPASRLDHLECSDCSRTVDPHALRSVCSCGAPYLARYDLSPLSRPFLEGAGMWRYAALLPHRGEPVTLGEGDTPILPTGRLGAAYEIPDLWLKDEAQNPTSSFKARGLSAAVTMAKALGARALAIPSAGNAGGALAAYGARAGLPVHVVLPKDTPAPFLDEAAQLGAQVETVDGLLPECGAKVREGVEAGRWFDVSTFREPYRVEGKKAMGLEIAAQMQPLPEVIVYPTGGGTGLVAIWKAMLEQQTLGWIEGPLPRMVAVQMEGCAPVVRAFEQGETHTTPWPEASTSAYGLRVPSPLGGALMLKTLRESDGIAIAVSEEAMLDGMNDLARLEGMAMGPETGAIVAGLRQLRQGGWLSGDERVLLLATGSALKYPDSVRAALTRHQHR